MSAISLLSLLFGLASANVYDVLLPKYLPQPGCTCAPWSAVSSNSSEQSRIDGYWIDGKAPTGAGSSCAMPGASAGTFECDGCTVDKTWNSFKGPWCYCTGGQGEQYCSPPSGVPEQINLQVAAPGIAVATFVTFESRAPSAGELPVGMLGKDKEHMAAVSGISHVYGALSQAESTNYTFHFIKFSQLEPRQSYFYKVRGGIDGSEWSDVFEFRAPYGHDQGITRIGSYGDMGHSHYNDMGNLKEDCAAGKIDTILHMGDHAYDMGNGGDKRGDAYMNAYQPALSGCPWVPVIGNHEGNDGDHEFRYLNMTFGETLGYAAAPFSTVDSTAETALADLLTKATLLGPGAHSGVPSHTSRWFSVDVGLIHIAALDLNQGTLGPEQTAWLEADLAAVDRAITPWVFGTSHFPLFNDAAAANPDASASWYTGEASEKYATSGHSFVPAVCDQLGQCERTVGELMGTIQSELMPILSKHKVDVWNAGHIHDYQSTWPVCYDPSSNASNICTDSAGQPIKNFNNPAGLVHVTEGNGGVPGVVGTSTMKQCGTSTSEWCRTHGTGGAYGRWTAYNQSVLVYEHVQNNGAQVTDTFTITK